MKHLPVAILATLLALALSVQGRLRVMSWNVENLFDTIHDSGRIDTDFLPDGANAWTAARYRTKLFAIARTIAAAGGAEPVDIIGLCEVENTRVVEDLTQHSALASLGYSYLITNSLDERGMDVALLYQADRFLPLQEYILRVPFTPQKERPTRDILVVDGLIPAGDTLTVAVCHLPSRRGGAELTAAYRQRAVQVLRNTVDSIARKRQNFRMIVMGDFNDEPADASVRQLTDSGFVNLSAKAVGEYKIKGTYKLSGAWSRIDQMIVSCSLLEGSSGLRAQPETCRIFAPEFLLERDATGGVKPCRTYLGTFYHGGVSDHLPLLLDLAY